MAEAGAPARNIDVRHFQDAGSEFVSLVNNVRFLSHSRELSC